MTNRQTSKRRVNLFFLELMIAILFFMLCSTVCVMVFVKSHSISAEAKDLNYAVLQAQTAASAVRSGEGSTKKSWEALETVFSSYDRTADVFTAWFNNEWRNCPEAEAVHQLTLRWKSGASLPTAEIIVETLKDAQVLYTLEVSTEKGGEAA